ncbi:MAG: methyltransferase domain-containing protein [Thermodesulfobacteriota bacterium]
MEWSLIQASRELARGRFPRVLKLPLVPDQFTLILEALGPQSRVLDVGANNRRLEGILRRRRTDVYYRSLDVDRRLPHDFHDLSEVREKFDLIACLDVVEHLTVEEAGRLLEGIQPVLDRDGLLFVSTPNVHHPTWFRRDCTHRTAFHYNELAGLVLRAGLREAEVFRVGELDFQGRLAFAVFKPLIKLLDLDYATSIVIRARK